MWNRRFLVLFVFIAASMPASAFERPFPPNAKRGAMTPAPYPSIVMDGKIRSLSSGARVWNAENLIELPAALRGESLPVNYTEDARGDIDRVWILTREEERRPVPNKDK